MPTGLFTRWDLDPRTNRFTPRQNMNHSLENMIMSCFQRTGSDSKVESFYTSGRQEKIDSFSVDGFCSQCNTAFEATGFFYHFCPRQEVRPSLMWEAIERASKKKQLDGLRRSCKQKG